MGMVLTRDLKVGDIISNNLVDSYGNILLKKGTRLNGMYLSTLKSAGIYYVAIETRLEIAVEKYEKLDIIKNTMLDAMPEFFNTILSEDKLLIEKHFGIVNEMIESIKDTGQVNVSIFDLKEYDDYTYVHSVNTSIMATFFGIKMNIKEEELTSLALGALLHDVGKLRLPIGILNKKERLTSEEFCEIKKHSSNGEKILLGSGVTDKIILDIVIHHHERLDGSGYPDHLIGDEISIYAKIVSVCDVFTALSANRSYRNRFNPNEAFEFILTGYDKMFDRAVVAIFQESFAIYPKGSKVRLSNGIEGVVINQNKGFPDRPLIQVYYDGCLKKSVKNYELNLLKYISLVIVDIL